METASSPRVSVIIPAYNCAVFIGEALESVFAQTYTDYEIIVVNDGSPDTPALEAALAPYLSRIVYVRQENRGPGGARNTGISRARGEFVAFLDSDDGWMPEFLASQFAMFGADPSLDLAYADAVLIGDSPMAGRTLMQGAPSSGEATFERLATLECVVFTSTVLARKGALVAAGLFDERFFHSEDWDLWLRVAHRGGRITYQRRVLGRHRVHAESLTAEKGALLRAQIRIAEKLGGQLPLTAPQRQLFDARSRWCEAQLALMGGKRHFVEGDFGEARQLLRAANRVLRSRKLNVAVLLLHVTPGVLRRLYLLWHRRWLAAERAS